MRVPSALNVPPKGPALFGQRIQPSSVRRTTATANEGVKPVSAKERVAFSIGVLSLHDHIACSDPACCCRSTLQAARSEPEPPAGCGGCEYSTIESTCWSAGSVLTETNSPLGRANSPRPSGPSGSDACATGWGNTTMMVSQVDAHLFSSSTVSRRAYSPGVVIVWLHVSALPINTPSSSQAKDRSRSPSGS